MKKGQTSKRGGYQDLLCPFTKVHVSQYSDRGTHKGSKAYDVTNGDGVRAPYYAPCDVKCVAVIPSYGEAIWQSTNKVRFANGKIDYYTFTTVHDNSFDAKVGLTRKQGQQIGNMGNKPTNICTGVHCHIEGCCGKTNKLVKNKYGYYILKSFKDEVLPRDTFFMDGTIIKKWFKPKYLKDVPVVTTKTMTVNTSAGLNMRDKASTKGKVILTLKNKAKVTYVKDAGTSDGYTWAQIKYNNKTGYVAKKYLK